MLWELSENNLQNLFDKLLGSKTVQNIKISMAASERTAQRAQPPFENISMIGALSVAGNFSRQEMAPDPT